MQDEPSLLTITLLQGVSFLQSLVVAQDSTAHSVRIELISRAGKPGLLTITLPRGACNLPGQAKM